MRPVPLCPGNLGTSQLWKLPKKASFYYFSIAEKILVVDRLEWKKDNKVTTKIGHLSNITLSIYLASPSLFKYPITK